MSASPNYRSETLRRLWRERGDEMRQRISEARRRRIAQDPEYRAQLKALCSALGKSGTGNACRPSGSAERQAIAMKVRDKRLAWCPEEYRETYAYLLNKKHVPAAEARVMIEAQMDRDGFPRPILVQSEPALPWSHPNAAEAGSRELGDAFAKLAAREASAPQRELREQGA